MSSPTSRVEQVDSGPRLRRFRGPPASDAVLDSKRRFGTRFLPSGLRLEGGSTIKLGTGMGSGLQEGGASEGGKLREGGAGEGGGELRGVGAGEADLGGVGGGKHGGGSGDCPRETARLSSDPSAGPLAFKAVARAPAAAGS